MRGRFVTLEARRDVGAGHRVPFANILTEVRTSPPSRGGAASLFLLRRADQELVDGYPPWARHDVADGVGDVFGGEGLEAGQALQDLLAHRFPQMALGPGSTTATRTCRLVTSWRSDSLNATTPNLVAAYTPSPLWATRPARELTLTRSATRRGGALAGWSRWGSGAMRVW